MFRVFTSNVPALPFNLSSADPYAPLSSGNSSRSGNWNSYDGFELVKLLPLIATGPSIEPIAIDGSCMRENEC
jgi:hypothetical protein